MMNNKWVIRIGIVFLGWGFYSFHNFSKNDRYKFADDSVSFIIDSHSGKVYRINFKTGEHELVSEIKDIENKETEFN